MNSLKIYPNRLPYDNSAISLLIKGDLNYGVMHYIIIVFLDPEFTSRKPICDPLRWFSTCDDRPHRLCFIATENIDIAQVFRSGSQELERFMKLDWCIVQIEIIFDVWRNVLDAYFLKTPHCTCLLKVAEQNWTENRLWLNALSRHLSLNWRLLPQPYWAQSIH